MTETKRQTLTDFLLARIAEDEQPTTHRRPHVLAECQAKRRIVEEAFRIAATIDGEWGCCHGPEAIRTGRTVPDFDDEAPEDLPSWCLGPDVAARFLSPLASVYSDHPDYARVSHP